MKKLITMILILALALPALALAEDEYYITDHYALHINDHSGNSTAVNGGRMFDFDSMTVDLFITSEQGTAYLITTTCTSGVFLSSGVQKVRIVTIGDQSLIVNDSGDSMSLDWDEDGDLWIDFGLSYFRMQHVKNMDAYNDRK